MSGDLVGGRFPLTYPFSKALALASNNAQSNISVRSNLEYLGMGGLSTVLCSVWNGAATGGSATLIPVPVEYGDLIQFVDVLTVAAAVGPTHSWAALYNSAGALVGSQSVDGGSAAIAASGRFAFTLGSKYIANPTDSPNGILYAAISVTASTSGPSLVSATVPAAEQYSWYTGMPVFLGGTSGSALGASAPASITLSGVTAVAAQPAVFLR